MHFYQWSIQTSNFFWEGEEGEGADPAHLWAMKNFRKLCRDVIWDSLLLLLLLLSSYSYFYSYSSCLCSSFSSYSYSSFSSYSNSFSSYFCSSCSFNTSFSCSPLSSCSSFCSHSCSLLSYLLIATLVQREFLSCFHLFANLFYLTEFLPSCRAAAYVSWVTAGKRTVKVR